jgi:hypothetical protein
VPNVCHSLPSLLLTNGRHLKAAWADPWPLLPDGLRISQEPSPKLSPDELLEGFHHLLGGLGDMHSVKGGCHSTCPTFVLAKPAANSVVLSIHSDSDQKLTLITILSLQGEKEAERSSQTLPWLPSIYA